MKNSQRNITRIFVGFVAVVFGTLAAVGYEAGSAGSISTWIVVALGAVAFVAGASSEARKSVNDENVRSYVKPAARSVEQENQADRAA